MRPIIAVLSKLANCLCRVRVDLERRTWHDKEKEHQNGKQLRSSDGLHRTREGEEGPKEERRGMSRKERKPMPHKGNAAAAPAKKGVSPKLTPRPIRVVQASWPHANWRTSCSHTG